MFRKVIWTGDAICLTVVSCFSPPRVVPLMAAQAARERKGPAAFLCPWRAFARVPVAIPYEVMVVRVTVRCGAGRFRAQPEVARRDARVRPAVAAAQSPPAVLLPVAVV
jgi:hypothetical protein